jgi:predicted flavoprotein YhiN
MVTTRGLESGPVYALSAPIRDAIARDGRCAITIDLHPDLTVDVVAARLGRRRTKDSLSSALRRTLGFAPVQVGLLREATANRLPRDAVALARLVKAVPVAVPAVMPLARAISTAGGVALDEVDESFMVRRLPGVYVIGEMLDWEAETGGYLLQATLSTAVTAARAAARRVLATR